MNTKHHKLVEEYIQAYNNLDPEGMVKNMHPELVFENRHAGSVDMYLEGKDAFLQQAKLAITFFSSRCQTVLKWEYPDEDSLRISLAYEAITAMDFPNGPKKGERLELKGFSTFRFKDGLIIYLLDERA